MTLNRYLDVWRIFPAKFPVFFQAYQNIGFNVSEPSILEFWYDLGWPWISVLTGPQIFQTAGSSSRLIGKAKADKRRTRQDRRRTASNKDARVKDTSSSVPCSAAASCQAEPSPEPSPIDTVTVRKWIPFPFSRHHHQRQRRRDPEGEGQSNSIEGQIEGHSDVEITSNDAQQHWLDVDLLRNDASNGSSVIISQ